MGNLTIELELVKNDLDCIINPDDYAEDDGALHADINARFTRDVALPAGGDTNTSDFFELSNAFVLCRFCTFDNLSNEFV